MEINLSRGSCRSREVSMNPLGCKMAKRARGNANLDSTFVNIVSLAMCKVRNRLDRLPVGYVGADSHTHDYFTVSSLTEALE